jgi:hypothetical protein
MASMRETPSSVEPAAVAGYTEGRQHSQVPVVKARWSVVSSPWTVDLPARGAYGAVESPLGGYPETVESIVGRLRTTPWNQSPWEGRKMVAKFAFPPAFLERLSPTSRVK